MATFDYPEGAFLDHDAVLRAIDSELAFPPFEVVLAAQERVTCLLKRSAPRAVVVDMGPLVSEGRA